MYFLALVVLFSVSASEHTIPKMPPKRRHSERKELLVFVFLFGVLTLLICDTAAGLASGLARGLAFAATAVLCAFAEILGIESLYTHDKFLRLF